MSYPYSYQLGIDLGSGSIGWFANILDENGIPSDILDKGTRIFSTGREDKGGEPLALNRRTQRSSRRRRDRNEAAKMKLIHLLTRKGLHPSDPQEIEALMLTKPYQLRAQAVSQRIKPYELGRVLVHLRQRRGFKSNRIADRNPNEKETTTQEGMNHLKEALNGRTLGEYLASCSQSAKSVRFRPQKEGSKNIYELYPQREMAIDELERIWSKQKEFHPQLTDELYAKVYDIIINQRPLKTPEPGYCALIKGEKRNRLADPLSQRVRILQEINSLQFNTYTELNTAEITTTERKELLELLTLEPSRKTSHRKSDGLIVWKNLRSKILKRELDLEFNLESEKRKGLKVDETAMLLAAKNTLGDRWFELRLEEQQDIIAHLIDDEDVDELIDYLRKQYTFTAEQAHATAKVNLPCGYARLSKQAMELILPFLEQGMVYSDACKSAGLDHSRRHEGELLKHLPYYGEVLEDTVLGGDTEHHTEEQPEGYYGRISNPTVHIGLNQLRKLVNELIKTYGRPKRIVVELARDLKHSPAELKKINARQTANAKIMDEAREQLHELNVKDSYDNRMKWKLWNEQRQDNSLNPLCPYTGTPISVDMLFSEAVQIEHILPYSRTFDNGPANKVIAARKSNQFKGNQSPYEAFSHSPGEYSWEDIIARSQHLPREKRWRFEANAMDKWESDDSENQPTRLLNDTRYLSRIALRYLKYICNDVMASNGRLTSILAHHWGLYKVIGDAKKNRDDNRHHTIDAFVLACTTPALVKQISTLSAKRREDEALDARKLLASCPLPWPKFEYDEFRRTILSTVVSHKPDHGDAKLAASEGRTSGKLHLEGNYGIIKKQGKGNEITVAKRIELVELDPKEKSIKEIANLQIRAALLEQYYALVSQNPTEAQLKQQWKQFLEFYSTETGTRRVRIHRTKEAITLRKIVHGESAYYRMVEAQANDRLEIYEYTNEKDKLEWKAEAISLFDAHHSDFIPKWREQHSDAKLALCLRKSDMVAMKIDNEWQIFIVTVTPKSLQVSFREHWYGGKSTDRKAVTKYPNTMRDTEIHKISVDILGRVHPARFRPVIS